MDSVCKEPDENFDTKVMTNVCMSRGESGAIETKLYFVIKGASRATASGRPPGSSEEAAAAPAARITSGRAAIGEGLLELERMAAAMNRLEDRGCPEADVADDELLAKVKELVGGPKRRVAAETVSLAGKVLGDIARRSRVAREARGGRRMIPLHR